jgi:hypothetical protein
MPLWTYLENIPSGAMNNSRPEYYFFLLLAVWIGAMNAPRRWKVSEHACARWLPVPTNNFFPIHTAQLIFSAKLAIRFLLANNCFQDGAVTLKDGDGGEYISINFRASPFNEDLSIDTTFS